MLEPDTVFRETPTSTTYAATTNNATGTASASPYASTSAVDSPARAVATTFLPSYTSKQSKLAELIAELVDAGNLVDLLDERDAVRRHLTLLQAGHFKNVPTRAV